MVGVFRGDDDPAYANDNPAESGKRLLASSESFKHNVTLMCLQQGNRRKSMPWRPLK